MVLAQVRDLANRNDGSGQWKGRVWPIEVRGLGGWTIEVTGFASRSEGVEGRASLRPDDKSEGLVAGVAWVGQ